MYHYEIEMQHSEESFTALSRMQYDLFCGGNKKARSLISLGAILTGIACSGDWWSLLAIGYGCYLTTSTYSAANHTARKLSAQIKESGCGFPHSRYLFEDSRMRILSLPDREELGSLSYSDIRKMGEDLKNFYLFRDEFGGYVIPKDELREKENAFRIFIEEKSGQKFRSKKPPILKLISRLTKSNS